MLGTSLLTKILADFLFGLYLLNSLLNHATNLIQNRCTQVEKMNADYKLTSKDKLTELAKSKGIETWNELTEFIKNLPYGRNKNRTDFGLVLSEKKRNL